MTLELDRDISGLSLSWSTPKHSTDVPWCVGQHGMGCPPLHEPSPLKNLHERQGLLLLSWCQPEPASTEETCEGASSGSDIPRVWVCPDGFLSSAGQEGGAVPAGLAPNRQPGGGDSLCQEPPACPQQREGQSHRGEWGGMCTLMASPCLKSQDPAGCLVLFGGLFGLLLQAGLALPTCHPRAESQVASLLHLPSNSGFQCQWVDLLALNPLTCDTAEPVTL